MSSACFDVAVVGAGPAGCAAALAAARHGASVVLVDPRPDAGDKPCGEGILPPGVEALQALGIEDVLATAQRFDRIRYRAPQAEPLEVPLPHPGFALARPELQGALDAALAARPEVERRTARARTGRTPEGFELDLADERLHARTLVAADGEDGTAADWLRRRGRRSPRIGVRVRARNAQGLDAVEVHVGGGCEVYLTPLPNGRVNAAALIDRAPEDEGMGDGAEALLAWALARHPTAADRLGTPATSAGARALDRRPPERVAGEGAFLAGDAAGAIDPVLGCGVGLALRSGTCAGWAAVRGLRGERPERAYAERFRRETRTRRRLAAALRVLGAHPRLLRTTLCIGRGLPALARALVRVPSGAGDTPLASLEP